MLFVLFISSGVLFVSNPWHPSQTCELTRVVFKKTSNTTFTVPNGIKQRFAYETLSAGSKLSDHSVEKRSSLIHMNTCPAVCPTSKKRDVLSPFICNPPADGYIYTFAIATAFTYSFCVTCFVTPLQWDCHILQIRKAGQHI